MKDDRLYLHHMPERCQRIARFIGPGKAAFMASEETQDAVIRNVEVIGEAAKRVSAEGRGHLTSLDWRGICGMRDVLIHYYIGVDLDEVWNVASARYLNSGRSWSRFWPRKIRAEIGDSRNTNLPTGTMLRWAKRPAQARRQREDYLQSR